MIEIILTDQEAEWAAALRSINFDDGVDFDDWKEKSEIMINLTLSIFRRDAVPKQRLVYFTEPEYNFSNPKISHCGTFEKNNRIGRDMYGDANFLDYLLYFIYGASLPDSLKQELSDTRRKWRYDNDFVNQAMMILKDHPEKVKMGYRAFSEEVFKASIDLGVSLEYSKSLRNRIKG